MLPVCACLHGGHSFDLQNRNVGAISGLAKFAADSFW
jgi:hypothetical protein